MGDGGGTYTVGTIAEDAAAVLDAAGTDWLMIAERLVDELGRR